MDHGNQPLTNWADPPSSWLGLSFFPCFFNFWRVSLIWLKGFVDPMRGLVFPLRPRVASNSRSSSEQLSFSKERCWPRSNKIVVRQREGRGEGVLQRRLELHLMVCLVHCCQGRPHPIVRSCPNFPNVPQHQIQWLRVLAVWFLTFLHDSSLLIR